MTRIILQNLRRHGWLSVAQIAARIDAHPGDVADALGALVELGRVTHKDFRAGGCRVSLFGVKGEMRRVA